MITIQLLEYALVLSKTLNFTRAATAMHTTQPAFSRAIAALENELNFKIFQRDKRSVSMTPEGQIFILEIEQAVSHYKNGIRLANRKRTDSQSRLRIGYVMDAYNHDIHDYCRLFQQAYAEIDVALYETYYYKIYSDLEDGTLDVVIFTAYNNGLPEKFDSKFLETYPLCLAIGPNHPKRDLNEVCASELLDENYILLAHDSSMSKNWSFVNQFAKDTGFSPTIVDEVRTTSSLLLQVACNHGVTVMPFRPVAHQFPTVKCIPIVGSRPCVREAVWCTQNDNPILPLFIQSLDRQKSVAEEQ